MSNPETSVSEAPPTTDNPLSRQMGRAALWSGLNSFLLRLGQFGVGIAVARVVAPQQFGVFAVALTVQTVIVNVSELGVSAALVRAKENIDRVARTVALISIVSSVLLCVLMALTAPALASALGAREAAAAVRVLSLTVLLSGITAVPYAILVRDFRQRTRFVADGANLAVSSVVVVLLGLAGFGAMALALSRVAGMVVTAVLLHLMVRPRYLPAWDRGVAGQVLRFSLPLAGADVVAFTLANIDYVVIGRTIGALPLGFYVLAFNIAGWPVSILGLMINEVALPAFAQVRDRPTSLPTRCRWALTLVALVAFPISALLFALAHPLVVTVYGHRWAEAGTVLAVLGLFGSVRILVALLTSILAALGSTRSVLVAQGAWLCSLVPALVLAVRGHGIIGAAVAQEVVGVAVVVPLLLWLLSRSGGGSMRGLLASFVQPLLGAVLAAFVAFGVADLAGSTWDAPSAARLVLGGAAGVAVYVLVMGRRLFRVMSESARNWDHAEV